MMDAMPAKDLLAIIEAFVAAHGGDTKILSIEWTLTTYGGGSFDVRIETLESWKRPTTPPPPREQPAPEVAQSHRGE